MLLFPVSRLPAFCSFPNVVLGLLYYSGTVKKVFSWLLVLVLPTELGRSGHNLQSDGFQYHMSRVTPRTTYQPDWNKPSRPLCILFPKPSLYRQVVKQLHVRKNMYGLLASFRQALQLQSRKSRRGDWVTTVYCECSFFRYREFQKCWTPGVAE